MRNPTCRQLLYLLSPQFLGHPRRDPESTPLSPADLEEIEAARACYMAALSEWLRHNPPPEDESAAQRSVLVGGETDLRLQLRGFEEPELESLQHALDRVWPDSEIGGLLSDCQAPRGFKPFLDPWQNAG